MLVIEDTAEIQLPQQNLVRFEARREQNGLPAVAIRDLLKAALRHRPDRIDFGGGPRKRSLRSPATPEHGTFGNAIHDSCKFRATGPRALHQLCFAERRGDTFQSHQDKHRRFAQRRHPCRAPAWPQIHFRSSPRQQLRPGCGLVRLRRRVPCEAGSPMSTDSKFAPRSLTASEYVRELFGPEDNAAILVRNRSTGHTVQTIAKAETIASPDFQSWLAGQSASGYDVFMGMNPIKDGALQPDQGRYKGYPPRLSRPRQKGRRGSRSDSKFNRSSTAKLRPRYLSRQAPSRVESKRVQSG